MANRASELGRELVGQVVRYAVQNAFSKRSTKRLALPNLDDGEPRNKFRTNTRTLKGGGLSVHHATGSSPYPTGLSLGGWGDSSPLIVGGDFLPLPRFWAHAALLSFGEGW